MIRRLSFSLLIFVLIFSMANASSEVRTITLENGLKVVMMPDASSPLISSLVIVKTGSSYETLATAGSTHLLEHMLFRGTEKRTQGDIYDGLDLLGAYNNAHTAKTFTNFILVVPKENALDAMDIQADMILHSTIPIDTFDVEKGRVIAEIEQSYNRASYPAEIAHLRNVYGESSYGFPTLGSVNGIKAISRDTVKKFHDDWYVVNNMTLVMRGDLTFREMEELANKVYGAEPARQLPQRPESWPTGFDDWIEGKLHITYGEARNGILNVAIPAPVYTSAEYAPFKLVISNLDDLLDSKLHPAGPPLVTYVYSELVSDHDFSVLNITANLMKDVDPYIVLEKIFEALKELSEKQYTVEELKTVALADKRSELFFSEQVQYGAFLLVPKLALADWGFWSDFDNKMLDVNPQFAYEVAAKYLNFPDYVASAYLPWPENAEDSGGIQVADSYKFELKNGLEVINTQIKGAPVAGIHIIAKNRALVEGSDHRGWGDILHRLLTTGTKSLPADVIEESMNAIGMEITAVDNAMIPMDDYRTTPEYSYIRVEVVSENWREAINFLGELMADDSWNQDDINNAATELKGIIDRQKGKVSGAAAGKLEEELYPNHLFAKSVYGDGSTLASIDKKDLREFHSKYFAANNLVVAMVAPASNEEAQDAMSSAFGKLKNSEIVLPDQANDFIPVGGTFEVTGSGRQGYMATGFVIPDVDTKDWAALKIANAMISDMIYRDLGEKKGWAYSAGSYVILRDNLAAWESTISLPDEHLQESIDAVYSHVKTIASGDFDEHRVEVARNYLLGKTLRRYSSRINLAMASSSDYFIYGDADFTWKMHEAIQNVTLDDIKAAAKKYLSKPKGVVKVLGHPEPSDGMPKGKMPPGMMGGGMGH